jgi:hypothetical protein
MGLSPRELFTTFATAMNTRDHATLEALTHPDFVAFMPQSGERSRGLEALILQGDLYPGGVPDVPPLPEVQLVGDDERWAITPGFTVVPLAAANRFTIIGRVPYPDGTVWHSVLLVELRDEKVYRMDIYFAPEMPAPLMGALLTGSAGTQ